VQKAKEKGSKASKDDKSEKERGLRKVEVIFKDQRVWYLHFKKDASDELLEVRLFVRRSLHCFPFLTTIESALGCP
jgi:hypothetical protein